MVSAVWLGYDDQALSLGVKEDGGRVASPIWLSYMKDTLEGSEALEFRKPSGLISMRIDGKTGLVASDTSKRVVTEYFIEGTEPTMTTQEEQLVSGSSQDFFMDE